MEAAHAFHTMRPPTEKDRAACAVLAQALVDGSDEAKEALEVGTVTPLSRLALLGLFNRVRRKVGFCRASQEENVPISRVESLPPGVVP